jgi:hypothetical protein
MAFNKIKYIKDFALELAEMNDCRIQDFDAEDIEYIGMECQCAYADVCEILGLALPESLGPVAA